MLEIFRKSVLRMNQDKLFGYHGNILEIDLSKGTILKKFLRQTLVEHYLAREWDNKGRPVESLKKSLAITEIE